MKLNFFFDVDGTLLPFGKGLPDSTLEAILRAKEKGHRIFVSTGRSAREMDQALSPIPFDGGVYSAGCTVMIGGRVIEERVFSKEQKNEVLDYLYRENQIPMIQSADGTYLSQEGYDFFKASLIKNNGISIKIPGLQITSSFPEDLEAKKILVLSPRGEIDKVREHFLGRYNTVPNTVGLSQSDMAEVCLLDADKGTGIKSVLSYLGEKRESSVAVGDGANDIEMVEYAGLGIAMGNADISLKERADWITDDVERDGLKKAIEYAESVYLAQMEG